MLFQISLKFVPGSTTNNISALDQVMAYQQNGQKPLTQ